MQVVSKRPLTNSEMALLMDRHDNAAMNSTKALQSTQLKNWFTTPHMYTIPQAKQVLLQLDSFPLYQQEKIHLVNLRPQNLVDLSLIINAQEEKLDNQQMHQVLAILKE